MPLYQLLGGGKSKWRVWSWRTPMASDIDDTIAEAVGEYQELGYKAIRLARPVCPASSPPTAWSKDKLFL